MVVFESFLSRLVIRGDGDGVVRRKGGFVGIDGVAGVFLKGTFDVRLG